MAKPTMTASKTCQKSFVRAEIPADPQVRANGLVVESVHPLAGRMREPRPPVRFEATPAELRRPAPGLGEHTDELLEELGVDGPERASLRARGILG